MVLILCLRCKCIRRNRYDTNRFSLTQCGHLNLFMFLIQHIVCKCIKCFYELGRRIYLGMSAKRIYDMWWHIHKCSRKKKYASKHGLCSQWMHLNIVCIGNLFIFLANHEFIVFKLWMWYKCAIRSQNNKKSLLFGHSGQLIKRLSRWMSIFIVYFHFHYLRWNAGLRIT